MFLYEISRGFPQKMKKSAFFPAALAAASDFDYYQ
jgi:hypothetical protein